ncbi:hypothetical protein QWY85_11235 [Neolewinella lacunae]|uniref:Uncharacterized protein n=1 Tax=Neolewinella lacunae TaxID=1517758 RepID=A0A923TA95_9BACT|nr:hypothetical protein [Neolewinella lacunae]MBC6995923.1 hypothetical protein [Neolewinella lacunae]MDN3635234.1 hypothetical protein [Neolewinella lacunae]
MRILIILILMLFVCCKSEISQETTGIPLESQESTSLLMLIHEIPRFSDSKKMRMIISQSFGRPILAVTIEHFDTGYYFCEKMVDRQENSAEYHERCTLIDPRNKLYMKLDSMYNVEYSKKGLDPLKSYGDATALHISSSASGQFNEFSLNYCDNVKKVLSLMEPLDSMITLFTLPTCKL